MAYAKSQLPEPRELERAFDEFVRLVEGIRGVRYVFAVPCGEIDFYTVLDGRRVRACRLVFEAEHRLQDTFPFFDADFHIIYLERRSINEVISPRPALFREVQDGHGEGAR